MIAGQNIRTPKSWEFVTTTYLTCTRSFCIKQRTQSNRPWGQPSRALTAVAKSEISPTTGMEYEETIQLSCGDFLSSSTLGGTWGDNRGTTPHHLPGKTLQEEVHIQLNEIEYCLSLIYRNQGWEHKNKLQVVTPTYSHNLWSQEVSAWLLLSKS